MNKKLRIEIILIAIIIIVSFLVRKEYFPKPIFFLLTIPTSMYFFPIKFILSKDFKAISIFSDFIVSLSITMSFVSLYLDKDAMIFDVLHLVLLVINIILAVLVDKEKNKYAHILSLSLIALINAV